MLAEDGDRTHDLLLTKEVLYQLSYLGARTPILSKKSLYFPWFFFWPRLGCESRCGLPGKGRPRPVLQGTYHQGRPDLQEGAGCRPSIFVGSSQPFLRLPRAFQR